MSALTAVILCLVNWNETGIKPECHPQETVER